MHKRRGICRKCTSVAREPQAFFFCSARYAIGSSEYNNGNRSAFLKATGASP